MTNTTVRVLVSIITIPLILFLCYFGEIPFAIFVLLIANIAFYEFVEMIKNKKLFANKILGHTIITLYILNIYLNFIEVNILVIISVIILLLSELFRNRESAVSNLGASFLVLLYIGLCSGAILQIREFYSGEDILYNEGGLLIISLIVTIWVCDSAAFFIGSAFGKHKLFPRVSPNKSWEGAIAGFIFSIITMIVAKEYFINILTMQDAVVIGIMVGVIGQIGDLVESLIKRDCNVKDSSAIIPGHGGIFDRFDSLLFVSPVVFVYLNYAIQT